VKAVLPESLGNTEALERHKELRDRALAAVTKFSAAQRVKSLPRMVKALEELGKAIDALALSE
jgi:hypothetical protein